MSLLRRLGDERFLTHRLRSTSAGGIAGCSLAAFLFAWHGYVDHAWRWDLLAVALTMVVVKWAFMGWYLIKE